MMYLCVDCGGSKTSAAISDSSGNVLGRALAGPSNFSYHSTDEFLSTVLEAVNGALKNVYSPEGHIHCQDANFAAVWFGISGVDSPAAVKSATDAVSPLFGTPPRPVVVANDAHLLAAPVRLHPDVSHAVVCIAGTGSICVSFKETSGGGGAAAGGLEELGRVGGWGWMLGDEGGGYFVGREAIRQLLRAHDRESVLSPSSSASSSSSQTADGNMLKARVLEHFGVTDMLEILRLVHLPDGTSSSVPREKRLSSLSPLVFAAAFEDGDPLALGVLRTSAGLLASQIALLLHPAPAVPAPADPEPSPRRTVSAHDSVLCFGGSLVGVEAYRTIILDILSGMGHTFRHVEFVSDAAVVGARGLAAACHARP